MSTSISGIEEAKNTDPNADDHKVKGGYIRLFMAIDHLIVCSGLFGNGRKRIKVEEPCKAKVSDT